MQRAGRAGLGLLAAFLVAPAAAPASAQVTVNPGALDLLPSQPSRAAPSRPAAPARPATRAPTHTTQQNPTAPATSPAALAAKPILPAVPPAIAALPPPAPVPPPRPVPVPVPSIDAAAPGTATPEANGLRITFGPDRQELNTQTDAALRTLARAAKASGATVSILAYAAGAPDDPSTPRRLSLARALAARAVLINEGIASSRIYPRALGAAGGDTDPDRIDVTAVAPTTPSPPK